MENDIVDYMEWDWHCGCEGDFIRPSWLKICPKCHVSKEQAELDALGQVLSNLFGEQELPKEKELPI